LSGCFVGLFCLGLAFVGERVRPLGLAFVGEGCALVCLEGVSIARVIVPSRGPTRDQIPLPSPSFPKPPFPTPTPHPPPPTRRAKVEHQQAHPLPPQPPVFGRVLRGPVPRQRRHLLARLATGDGALQQAVAGVVEERLVWGGAGGGGGPFGRRCGVLASWLSGASVRPQDLGRCAAGTGLGRPRRGAWSGGRGAGLGRG
jgi:hypothetical protein